MVNNATETLIFATPVVASAAVTGAAWWTQPGRAALRAGRAAAMGSTAVALGLYCALGIVARRVATVVGLWALSLVPLYYFAFFAWIAVARYTQCGPQAYECPV